MGTWGSGSFDNDDASDFAIDFEQAGVAALNEAFDITEVEYLEGPAAQRAVAAAEILALTLSDDTSEAAISPELDEAIRRYASDIKSRKRGLTREALAALDRVEADQSELKEVWEQDDTDQWTAAMADLRERLVL